ncbi:hypothetical protein CBR_g29379 [Chara braunii]|uniref:Uncharacterized protein n=1 Tax=Chara braunii TaxID=69332 RepID=A0A388JWM1_CHABU|nr:hypothetical protein CBR_g29379 [Chara braunii]|eukprot:GBG62180.1 hypothetical protein CBR_g29379 [Chara braunii]
MRMCYDEGIMPSDIDPSEMTIDGREARFKVNVVLDQAKINWLKEHTVTVIFRAGARVLPKNVTEDIVRAYEDKKASEGSFDAQTFRRGRTKMETPNMVSYVAKSREIATWLVNKGSDELTIGPSHYVFEFKPWLTKVQLRIQRQQEDDQNFWVIAVHVPLDAFLYLESQQARHPSLDRSGGNGVYGGSPSPLGQPNAVDGRVHRLQNLRDGEEARRAAVRNAPPTVGGAAATGLPGNQSGTGAGSPSGTASPGDHSSTDASGSTARKSQGEKSSKGKGCASKRADGKSATDGGKGKCQAESAAEGETDGDGGGVGGQTGDGGSAGVQTGSQPRVVWTEDKQLVLVRCKIDYDMEEESLGRSCVKHFKPPTERKLGSEDYFTMSTKVKKTKKLDFCLKRAVFDLMYLFYKKDPSLNPTNLSDTGVPFVPPPEMVEPPADDPSIITTCEGSCKRRKTQRDRRTADMTDTVREHGKATASAFASVKESQKENTVMIMGVMDKMNMSIAANGASLSGALTLIAQAFLKTPAAANAASTDAPPGSA